MSTAAESGGGREVMKLFDAVRARFIPAGAAGCALNAGYGLPAHIDPRLSWPGEHPPQRMRGLSRPSRLGSHRLAILSGMRGSTLAIVLDDRSPAHDKAI